MKKNKTLKRKKQWKDYKKKKNVLKNFIGHQRNVARETGKIKGIPVMFPKKRKVS